MAERKVLNKYYPPDFDPSKLRGFEKKTVRRMCSVRMMLPMSVRCYTCGNYMHIGTKFNMKVEAVKDVDYLGIKIYRFLMKCTQCYSEITFLTDPKNHDYVAERGASRNHETWRDMVMADEEYQEKKQSEIKEDAMKSLEHRTYDSKREMDILDALDQVKSLNRRQGNINYDELIQKAIYEEEAEPVEVAEADDAEIKEKFLKVKHKRIGEQSRAEELRSFDMTSHLAKKYNINDDSTTDNYEKSKKNAHSLFINNNSTGGLKIKIKKKDIFQKPGPGTGTNAGLVKKALVSYK